MVGFDLFLAPHDARGYTCLERVWGNTLPRRSPGRHKLTSVSLKEEAPHDLATGLAQITDVYDPVGGQVASGRGGGRRRGGGVLSSCPGIS